MATTAPRNRLMPWYIGIVIIVLAVAYVGYQMFLGGCPAPGFVEFMVLAVIPVVYIGLMYLTFISQE